jgi:4-hydroxybenzoate polyprenyltransferase
MNGPFFIFEPMNVYFNLIKFSHTIFALPFALVGFFMGSASFADTLSFTLLIKVLLCMIFARSAAMAFNRWLDRDIDSINPRTVIREIPSGKIAPSHVLIFVILCCTGFILTAFTINELCFYLSPVALLVVLGYSYTKRFTALCHLVLGAGLALAPVGAYIAVTGSFSYLPVIVGLAVLTWVAGFDIIYALQDDEFDRSHKLYSVPAMFGRKKALFISSVLHVFTVIFLLWAMIAAQTMYPSLHWIYLAGTFVFIVLLYYQHRLVKADDLSKVDMAFFTTNGVASLIFGSFFIIDILI